MTDYSKNILKDTPKFCIPDLKDVFTLRRELSPNRTACDAQSLLNDAAQLRSDAMIFIRTPPFDYP